MQNLPALGPLSIHVAPADRIRGPPPEAYKNQSNPRGAIFIVNWKNFQDSNNHPERSGSDRDVENICCLFTQIGYECTIHEDLTKEELFEELNYFKENEIHKSVDSLVCVFMSHGNGNSLLTSNGHLIDVEEIYHVFDNDKCVALAGKPKLFFFQHCRNNSGAVTEASGFQFDGRSIVETPNLNSFPSIGISDTFLCFSTERGSVAQRDPINGSVFIENVCRVFMESAKDTHIYDLIPKINNNLLGLETPFTQRCEFRTIFHRHAFYFNPKGIQADEQSSKSNEAQHLTLGTGEETTMELQPSTSWGLSAILSNVSNFLFGVNEAHKYPAEDPTESSLTNVTYGLNDYPRGYLYILNNLKGCNEDVLTLKEKFHKLGFEVIIMPKIHSYQLLKRKISQYNINRNATVLVFFFGYGYDDYIFFAENYEESVSFKVFIEAFSLNREKGNASILFTNTCFKSKTPLTITHREPKEPVWDTFHVCIKVNGECLRGSILTKVLLQEFEENGSKQEFADFSRHVTCKIEELQRDDQDTYITDVRYYGVCKHYYFNSPSEEKGFSAREGRSLRDVSETNRKDLTVPAVKKSQVPLQDSLSVEQDVQCFFLRR